ncbi:YegP family protein [Lentiprolixibacter aurantiacus]|uniref:YegP family protein n=1 Tax=Lentiprolixibacter aurantiacus TaxID=2993939 RepID=A0AAE3MK97_9FLAO|nr:YegP family protein [Lentiprolixibacter aurantiacus]MCX2718687.1 YegP family protein [Lentiprolixibacter aurantiacus]
MGKFEIKKDKAGKFRFNLKAGNGQVILSSEAYNSKSACDNGIESVRKNSADDARFERKTAKNGKAYFNLKAANGQVIGASQMYASEASMENGIASVKNNAPDASIDDQSE